MSRLVKARLHLEQKCTCDGFEPSRKNLSNGCYESWEDRHPCDEGLEQSLF